MWGKPGWTFQRSWGACALALAATIGVVGPQPTFAQEIVPSAHAPNSLLSAPSSPYQPAAPPMAFGSEARSIDGTGNNVTNPSWGSAGIALLRHTTTEYGDSVSTPAGASRPGARLVSSTISKQTGPLHSPEKASDFVWQWGQFVDHDIALSEIADPEEPFDIPVPIGEPYFDPGGVGGQVIELNRVAWDASTGTDPGNPRQQLNFITAYVDASNVYGSDPVRADALRLLDGSGKLRTSAGDLPPFNTGGLPNAGGTSSDLFLAGDIRANEQIALTAVHTLFLREHNRLCDEMALADPMLTGEELYQQARAIVGALMQVITYNEFLPALLGPTYPLAAYTGYDDTVNAGLSNFFATGAYRMGHSMLSVRLYRMDANNEAIPEDHSLLHDAFFNPDKLVDEGGIEPLLRGLAYQRMQKVDPLVVGEVRNLLFGPGAFDLAALNIQRGRDHGLPDYNQARVDFGLPAATSLLDITHIPSILSALASLYGGVNNIDAWVGLLSEIRMPGGLVGELTATVLRDQFERLRDGDRFWYQNVFSGQMLADLEATRLSDVIRRNTPIDDEIRDNVFVATQIVTPEIPSISPSGMAALALLMLTAGVLFLHFRRSATH